MKMSDMMERIYRFLLGTKVIQYNLLHPVNAKPIKWSPKYRYRIYKSLSGNAEIEYNDNILTPFSIWSKMDTPNKCMTMKDAEEYVKGVILHEKDMFLLDLKKDRLKNDTLWHIVVPKEEIEKRDEPNV